MLIWEVIEAAKTKPFGFQAFYPGPGLGRHCIPIDPYYLSWKSKEFDFQTRFIELAGEINTSMPYHVVASVAKALNRHKKSINGSKVLAVTGFDVDQKKVNTLMDGGSYIVRIESSDIKKARTSGFSATADYSRIADHDAIIICVPTPLDEYREPDLSYITSTAESIAPHLRAGQLVILESTSYPGTTEEVLVPILEERNRLGLKAARIGNSDPNVFYVAFSPEREDPGRTDIERHDVPKVVGGLDSTAGELACSLYNSIFRHFVL